MKALEDINLEEIVQLLKLLQEVMRISSDANRAMMQHQQSLSQLGSRSHAHGPGEFESRFLTQGGVQVMRCAKLLSYLMIEYEVPVIVRHAVRCARLFFFGLVDFHKLVPFRLDETLSLPAVVASADVAEGQESKAEASSL